MQIKAELFDVVQLNQYTPLRTSELAGAIPCMLQLIQSLPLQTSELAFAIPCTAPCYAANA